MGRCKEIVIKVIPAAVANPFVKAHHYSGKVVPNSQLHFGAFLDGKLHGVLSYGCSMDKRKTMALVKDTGWNEFLELNRMAFDDYLPRNSESYCIGATLRMIKKQAPHIKWIISFADGTQCGDGTIYRASNFVLTGITRNKSIIKLPNDATICISTISAHPDAVEIQQACRDLGVEFKRYTVSDWKSMGGAEIDGYQLRYVYFLDKASRAKLTVPELPFSAIDEIGAGLYKNEHISREERHKKCEAQLEREQRKQQQQPETETAK
jgi:hypothetical protein